MPSPFFEAFMNSLRPPYVTFERRSVEDRAMSLKTGVYTTKEVDFIILVPHGSEGKTRLEYVYEEWLQRVRPHSTAVNRVDDLVAQESRFPQEWLERIEQAYKAWKKGEDMEVEGTPIKNWPVLSPGQVQTCLSMHILSVEELAAASDEAISSMGMGWIALRQRARDWLSMKNSDATKTAAELEALRSEVKARDVRIASLEEQIAELTKRLEAASTATAK